MKTKSLFAFLAISAAMAFGQTAGAAGIGSPAYAGMYGTQQNADGTFHYQYYVTGGWFTGVVPDSWGDRGYASDFYLPYFADMGVQNITLTPTQNVHPLHNGPLSQWNYSIEATNDIFNIGGGALHFYTSDRPNPLDYNDVVVDFDGAADAVDGNYDLTLIGLESNTLYFRNDAISVPGRAATTTPPVTNDVPEPGTLALIGAGIALLARRRKA